MTMADLRTYPRGSFLLSQFAALTLNQKYGSKNACSVVQYFIHPTS